MSRLPPKKRLDIAFEDARRLPLAVVVQRGINVKVYRIEAENARSYFNSFEFTPSTDSVEGACKMFGKEISKEEFEKASVYPIPAQEGGSARPDNPSEYIVYRAKFEEVTSKKSCDTQSGICK